MSLMVDETMFFRLVLPVQLPGKKNLTTASEAQMKKKQEPDAKAIPIKRTKDNLHLISTFKTSTLLWQRHLHQY